MLALSFLLCAAGVKAMLGIKVDGVEITDKEYVCADDCTFEGVWFGENGNVCAAKELVVVLHDGKVNPKNIEYACAEAANPEWSTRPPMNGEEPESCFLDKIDPLSPVKYNCEAKRISKDKKVDVNADPVLEQWSEVRKMLGLPPSQEAQGCGQATDGATKIDQ
ncbi:uncharacterized protein G6M90_00g068060 [Metarhizium brunneum]|uniref:Uncharacterized protein n=1 Tax=Metarhizium brunneum TaxID=500148 RepID=A0A7D5Z379_9HYPO